jgi:predicted RecB family nuclease
MNITSAIFEAYLKCPTKCFLRAHGEAGTGNLYADWVRTETESYKNTGLVRLSEGFACDEIATGLTGAIDVKTAKWRLAVDLTAHAPGIDTRLHSVERIPSPGRGKSGVFIPIRFIFPNKLTTDDKLLLGFDAFALSSVLGRTVDTGKIIHGEDRTVSKVKVSGLRSRIGKAIEKLTTLLATGTPPELVLRKYCVECEFQSHCRQKAVEKDDLSLLSGMTENEHKQHRNRGIFTVTQLSHTFRPRHRPKHLASKREGYHHSLKALAIREKKIHIVGSPEFRLDGTPVYLKMLRVCLIAISITS